jgi:hypothetical protein
MRATTLTQISARVGAATNAWAVARMPDCLEDLRGVGLAADHVYYKRLPGLNSELHSQTLTD